MARLIGIGSIVWLGWVGFALDWPQFNGPNRNGVSNETGLAEQWPQNGPAQVWQLEVGPGFGGAVVQGGRVFFTDRLNDEKDLVRCVDLATGKPIWQMEQDRPGRLPYNGSRCTPTVADGMVYAVSPFGYLYAVYATTGELKWTKEFAKDLNADPPYFGYSHSPLIVGDLVVIAPMAEKATLMAFHKDTGEKRWSSGGTSGEAYVSPLFWEAFNYQHILILDTEGVKGISPKNGQEIWRYEGYKNRVPIPHPIMLPGNRIFLTGGYGGGSVMLQLSGKGHQTKATEIFRLEKRGSQIHQVLYYRDHLYANFNNNENLQAKNPEGLICIGLDGKTAWQTNNVPDVNRGNLLIADGKIYTLGGEDGVLRMIEATPRGYRELGSAKIFETKEKDNMIWAPMALADGKLILRDQSVMKCLTLR